MFKFFKDNYVPVLSIMGALTFLNMLLKVMMNLIIYDDYNKVIRKGDMEDVGVTSLFIFVGLVFALFLNKSLKTCCSDEGTSLLRPAAKYGAVTIIPTATLSGINTFIKFLTDWHEENKNKPGITKSELVDMLTSSCYVLFALIVVLGIKNSSYFNNGKNCCVAKNDLDCSDESSDDDVGHQVTPLGDDVINNKIYQTF